MNLQNTGYTWGWFAIGFHWITVIAVVGMFSLGLWMVELTYYDKWYKTAPFIHKSTGATLFILSLARLAWRLMNVTPEALKTHSTFEKKTAKRVHYLLYIVMFSVMLSGYLISTADGRPVDVFNLFQVPALIHGFEKQEDIAGLIHLILAITLISLATVHALAAIKHHFFDKDRTLLRMLGR